MWLRLGDGAHGFESPMGSRPSRQHPVEEDRAVAEDAIAAAVGTGDHDVAGIEMNPHPGDSRRQNERATALQCAEDRPMLDWTPRVAASPDRSAHKNLHMVMTSRRRLGKELVGLSTAWSGAEHQPDQSLLSESVESMGISNRLVGLVGLVGWNSPPPEDF